MGHVLAVAVALLLLLAFHAEAASRSVWIWEPETFRMLEDRAFRDGATRFLKEHKVGRVFLYADEYQGRNILRDQCELYHDLVKELRTAGIDVHALLGSAYLDTQTYILPERTKQARAMLRRVLAYNDAAKKGERFTGVHFDIEPHLLREWKIDRMGLSALFLDRFAEWVAMEKGSGLEMSAAIPFWFDGYEVSWRHATLPMSEHVQALLDVVVLMDYRDRAEGRDGIIRHASTEIEWAAKHGKRVVIGVDTGDSEPSKVTFLQEGKAALERELAATRKAYAGNAAFAGFAVHHLQTWMELKE